MDLKTKNGKIEYSQERIGEVGKILKDNLGIDLSKLVSKYEPVIA